MWCRQFDWTQLSVADVKADLIGMKAVSLSRIRPFGNCSAEQHRLNLNHVYADGAMTSVLFAARVSRLWDVDSSGADDDGSDDASGRGSAQHARQHTRQGVEREAAGRVGKEVPPLLRVDAQMRAARHPVLHVQRHCARHTCLWALPSHHECITAYWTLFSCLVGMAFGSVGRPCLLSQNVCIPESSVHRGSRRQFTGCNCDRYANRVWDVLLAGEDEAVERERSRPQVCHTGQAARHRTRRASRSPTSDAQVRKPSIRASPRCSSVKCTRYVVDWFLVFSVIGRYAV